MTTQQRKELVSNVLNAVHDMQETAGSSVKQIVDYIKSNADYFQGATVNQLTRQVRQVLDQGVKAGYFKKSRCRYTLDLSRTACDTATAAAAPGRRRRGLATRLGDVPAAKRGGRRTRASPKRRSPIMPPRQRPQKRVNQVAKGRVHPVARRRLPRGKAMRHRQRNDVAKADRRRQGVRHEDMDVSEDEAPSRRQPISHQRHIKTSESLASAEFSNLLISKTRPKDAAVGCDAGVVPMDSDRVTKTRNTVRLSREELEKMFTKHVAKEKPEDDDDDDHEDVDYMPPPTAPTVTLNVAPAPLYEGYTGRVTRSMTRRANQMRPTPVDDEAVVEQGRERDNDQGGEQSGREKVATEAEVKEEKKKEGSVREGDGKTEEEIKKAKETEESEREKAGRTEKEEKEQRRDTK